MEREVSPAVAGQERTAVSRGQNSVLTLEHDAPAVRRLLGMVFDRVEGEGEGEGPGARAIQAVILAADVDTVVEIGRIAATIDHPAGVSVLAMPSGRRGARAMRAAIPTVVIATPADLLTLVRESLAKLQGVRLAVFAWPEELVDEADALATVIAELPKDAARILIAARLTSDVEEFAERHVRRIARATPAPDEPVRTAVWFVRVTEAGKPAALRRVLDSLDPARATIYARSDDGARAARAELAGMGTAATGVVVTQEPVTDTGDLLILYELPHAPRVIRALSGDPPAKTVALVRTRDLPALGSLTTGPQRPLALGGPADRARVREAAMRDSLRAILDQGVPAREVLALEPLLDEYDGIEIAAAALRLLDRVPPAPAAPAAATERRPAEREEERAAQPTGTVRVFFGVGSRDGAAPRDLVGAIANVGGIPSDRIGKVDVRESHTLVELRASDAEAVVEKMAGATIRGRRAAARIDRDRGDRGERGERRERGERSERPRGEFPRRGRPGERQRDDRAAKPGAGGARQRPGKGAFAGRERGAQRRDDRPSGRTRRSD